MTRRIRWTIGFVVMAIVGMAVGLGLIWLGVFLVATMSVPTNGVEGANNVFRVALAVCLAVLGLAGAGGGCVSVFYPFSEDFTSELKKAAEEATLKSMGGP
jgi:hypothetical protein